MFQEDRTKQPGLFAFSHRDLVDPESDVWLYIDLFDALDVSEFDEAYELQGQAAKEPRLMLRTLFYGLTHGVVSGRKLAEVCRNDNRFIVLSGNLRPDRRTLDRFIRRHEKRFSDFFVQVVRLAQKMKLVSLGRVALDGSKFKGAADRDMQYAKMGRALDHIEENLRKLQADLAEANVEEATELEEKLSQEIQDQTVRRDRIARAKAAIEADFSSRGKKRGGSRGQDKARRALVDPEALPLSNRRGGFMHGYNVQAAVDETSQMVVAGHVHDNATDFRALPILVDQVKENCGTHAQSYLADNGYQSLANVKKLKDIGSKAVICRKPSKTKNEADEEIHEQVFRGSHDREYFCKDGRFLHLACRDKEGWLNFKMPKEFCKDCPHQKTCHLFGKKHPQVFDDPDREIYTAYIAFSRTEEWKEAYKRRKAIVEPVFGNIKNKGIRIFVRGKKAVSAWWKIAMTAHNIEKIVGQMAKQPNPSHPLSLFLQSLFELMSSLVRGKLTLFQLR